MGAQQNSKIKIYDNNTNICEYLRRKIFKICRFKRLRRLRGVEMNEELLSFPLFPTFPSVYCFAVVRFASLQWIFLDSREFQQQIWLQNCFRFAVADAFCSYFHRQRNFDCKYFVENFWPFFFSTWHFQWINFKWYNGANRFKIE